MGIICNEERKRNQELTVSNQELTGKNQKLAEKNQKLKNTKENVNVISQLQSFDLDNDDSNFEENLLKKIKEPKSEDPSKFYDVIIPIQSIKDINKGWNIKFSQNFEKDNRNIMNQKLIKIGVIGNSNKGKSIFNTF